MGLGRIKSFAYPTIDSLESVDKLLKSWYRSLSEEQYERIADFESMVLNTLTLTTLTVNTMTLSTGSIVDTTGAISFGNENLSTTGTLGAGNATLGTIACGNTTVTGTLTATSTVTIPTALTGVIRADSGVLSVDSDVTDIVAAASTTVAGKIEIATGTETNTGTSATLAVSPDALDDWTGSAQITTLGTIVSGTWQGTSIAVTYTDAKCTDATADNTVSNETSHADVVQDGDFTSNGILKRTGAGSYGIVTDNSATWDNAQAGHAMLTSLAAMTYASGSFVSITGANTAAIRTYAETLSDIGAEPADATIVKDADFGSAGLCATNGSGIYSIVADASANWNTAYGWGDHASGGYQAGDTGLTSLAGLVYAADSMIKVTATDTYAIRTMAEVRTDLGLVIGTNVQAQDVELAAIAGLTSAADRYIRFTGSGTADLRTYANVLGDIGAAASSHAMSTHSDEDTYAINTSGTLTAGNATLGTIGCGTITSTGNLVVPANGVVGVTDGNPQIVFDNANNWLEITGDVGIGTATVTLAYGATYYKVDMRGHLRLEAANPLVTWRDTDVAINAGGLWRWLAVGGEFLIQRNTHATTEFASANDAIKILVDDGIKMAFLKTGINQGAAGAAAGELWVDTDDDNTIKMGV